MKYSTIILVVFMAVGCSSPDPQPGEIWRYEYVGKGDDPFKDNYNKAFVLSMEDSVLAVKDGYVQFVIRGSSYKFSSEIYNFKIDSKKVSP
jgi:hypothetical protein